MKAITITSNQYTPRSLSWTYLHVCDATDFVFIPPLHAVESDASSKMVEKAAAVGIVNGIGNNMFAPKQSYTKEQSIITILRIFKLLLL